MLYNDESFRNNLHSSSYSAPLKYKLDVYKLTVVMFPFLFSGRNGHAFICISLTAAVMLYLSGLLLMKTSHCVVTTKAGASLLVKSATNTTSGFLTTMFISIVDTGCTGASKREIKLDRLFKD